MTTETSIVAALSNGSARSTDSLASKAGGTIGMNELAYLDYWRGKVYRSAVKMEKAGTLTSTIVYGGKSYQRVWRLA